MKSFRKHLEEKRCWPGYKPVPGKKPYSPGSCTKEEVEKVEEAKSPAKPDRYHIIKKDGTPANLVSYEKKETAIAVRDEKHPDAEVHQLGARGKIKSKFSSKMNEDWQKVNKSDNTDGLSQKAVDAYRRENPGSKLQTAVTKDPSKLKKGSKDSKRRLSFCRRMRGMKNRLTNPENARDPDSPVNKALRRWNC